MVSDSSLDCAFFYKGTIIGFFTSLRSELRMDRLYYGMLNFHCSTMGPAKPQIACKVMNDCSASARLDVWGVGTMVSAERESPPPTTTPTTPAGPTVRLACIIPYLTSLGT
ncbi:hypothetical protein J6590_051255 [Homalodisca vitripennis]|nr:hypothetical protein J6590_051255 [Homalodisca vitripennis]